MRTLNLGILAHVDAGKTSLTERLLYAAGVIDKVGRVDDGNTQTDTLDLERQRGITIKSAVVSFEIDDLTINLIDTPGHPDFIAEVERVLGVLDGAVLVISAVEVVQPQTRILMRALQRLAKPTLIFVNKIDRVGANPDRVVAEIVARLSPEVVALGTVDRPGSAAASFVPFEAADEAFRSRLTDLIASVDDAFIAAYLRDERAGSYPRLRRALAEQTKRARVHPILFGSAMTGAGIAEVIAGIAEFLPAIDAPIDEPLAGTVFKIERGPAGEKIAYARLFSGAIRVRDRVPYGEGHAEKITAIDVFERGAATPGQTLVAGHIGKLWGLGAVQIGDRLGHRRSNGPPHHFAPPTLETVVVPRWPGDLGPLHAALSQLAEQDPLINVRQDDLRQEIAISLYGEVQKEVIQATLASDYGLEATFRESTTICIERPIGIGSAVEYFRQPPNPFLATVGLRIEPGPIGSGVRFQLAIDVHGTMPAAFFAAVEETVRATMRQGLHGWEVTEYFWIHNCCIWGLDQLLIIKASRKCQQVHPLVFRGLQLVFVDLILMVYS
jgi:ribosomal protection tetracycline resistance protein